MRGFPDSVRRRLCLAGLIAVVIAAPQAYGGNHALARRLLLVAAAALAALWPGRLGARACALFVWTGVALLALATIQLTPLPASWVRVVSPRAVWVRGLALGDAAAAAPQCLSLAPARTALAAEHLAMATLLCAVACALASDPRAARALMCGLVTVATFEAGYAFATSYTLGPSVWGHALVRTGRLSGTYVNSDHFAGLLAMAFPLALVLAWSTAPVRVWGRTWVLFAVRWIDRPRWGLALLCYGGAILMGLAILLSLSRAAIAILALAITLLAALELARSRARVGQVLTLGVVVGLMGLAFVAFGATRLVLRFEALTDHAVERFEIARETAALVGDFPWTGAGFGAFEAVHPAYQRIPRLGLVVNSAHSDFLELASEAGVPVALAVFALALVPLVRLVVRALDPGRPGEARRTDAGLAAAWLVVITRAAIDFDLRTPGNVVAAATIAGLIAARTTGEASQPGSMERGLSVWPPLVVLALAVQWLRPLDSAVTIVDRAETRVVQARASVQLDFQYLIDDLGGRDATVGLRASMARLAVERQQREIGQALGELISAYQLAVVQEPGEPRTHAKLAYWLAALAVNGEARMRAPALRHASAARVLFGVGDRWHVFSWVAELALEPASTRPLFELSRIMRRYSTELELLARLAAPLGLAEPIARTLPVGDQRTWRRFAATSLALQNWAGAVRSLDRLVEVSGIKRVEPGRGVLQFEARVRDGGSAVVACARIDDGHAAHLVVGREWGTFALALARDGDLLLYEATSLYQLGSPPVGTIEVRARQFKDRPANHR